MSIVIKVTYSPSKRTNELSINGCVTVRASVEEHGLKGMALMSAVASSVAASIGGATFIEDIDDEYIKWHSFAYRAYEHDCPVHPKNRFDSDGVVIDATARIGRVGT